jgi:hypothetical protein
MWLQNNKVNHKEKWPLVRPRGKWEVIIKACLWNIRVILDFVTQDSHQHRMLVKLQFQNVHGLLYHLIGCCRQRTIFHKIIHACEHKIRLFFVKPKSLLCHRSKNTIMRNIVNNVKHFKRIKVNVQYMFCTNFVKEGRYISPNL